MLRAGVSAMAAEKNLLGFIDLGREVRRPPLVGVQFLHQRAVRAADFLGARPQLHAKDLIGLLLRHFARARAAPFPLPHQPARVHASRAPGGQDTQPVAPGSRRRSRSACRAASPRRARRARRLRGGPARMRAAHRAAVVIELHLDEGRAHPRHLARRLLRALEPTGRRERPPAQQPQAEQTERDRDFQMPAKPEKRGQGQRADATGRRSTFGQRFCGSALL